MSRFSPTLWRHLREPRGGGKLPDANAVGEASLGGRAPYVTIYLRVNEETVVAARFTAFGCGVTLAACSALVELATGRTVKAGLELTPNDVAVALDGLPADRAFCAEIAVAALRQALNAALCLPRATNTLPRAST